MNRCINDQPQIAGIDSRLMVLYLTLGAASFFSIGSIKIALVCLGGYLITRIVSWYDPQFFPILGGYLQISDLFARSDTSASGKPFSSVLPWNKIEEVHGFDGCMIRNKDGSIQSTYRIVGLDFLSMAETEIRAAESCLNEGMKLFSEHGVTIFLECRRKKVSVDNQVLPGEGQSLPYAIKMMLDEQAHLFDLAQVFENKYYLTVVFKNEVAERRVSKLAAFFLTSGGKDLSVSDGQDIKKFRDLILKFDNLISGCFGLIPLNRLETLEYLHSCISTAPFEPNGIASGNEDALAATIPDVSLTKALNPVLGNEYIKAVGLKGLPDPLSVKVREEVSGLAVDFRWMIRADLLKKDQAKKTITAKKIAWANSSFNWTATLASMFTGIQSGATEKFETRMADECQAIQDDLKEGQYVLCNVVTTFITMNEDEGKANDKADKITKALGSHRINANIEGLNTALSLLSAIPGTYHKNPRQFVFTSRNLIEHFLPLNSPWAGSLDEDCLFVAKGRD